jgi:4-hydroxybenzoate polyprenyltransferase
MSWFVIKKIQPQAYLGLVHNWGATLGWAAVMGNLNDIGIFLPVHIAGICWTLVYDTIYAHQV